MAVCGELGHETAGDIECRTFVDFLINCQILKKKSVLLSLFEV